MAILRMESVSYKSGSATLLADADLAFGPGKLTAVIGPSGSGKSTLLKCLTTTHRPTRGSVTLDGVDIWQVKRPYRLNLGYVPQDDVIHPQLTVRAAFTYAAMLRLDSGLGGEALAKRVETVTRLLGLADAAKRRVFRLSGGQRKRVNVGIELLADPQILVLDEPASGLDPGTEEDLVKLLNALARAGRTVVTTTHSMEFLSAVDRIVALAAGNIIFCGTHAELLEYFQVAHAADLFKAIRGRDIGAWTSRYRSSRLADKAREA